MELGLEVALMQRVCLASDKAALRGVPSSLVQPQGVPLSVRGVPSSEGGWEEDQRPLIVWGSCSEGGQY